MFLKLLKINLAIWHQDKAIKHAKSVREQYLDMNLNKDADDLLNTIIEQESVITYLNTEKEKLKSYIKEIEDYGEKK